MCKGFGLHDVQRSLSTSTILCDSVIFKLAGCDPAQFQHSRSKSVGYCRSDCAALQVQAFMCVPDFISLGTECCYPLCTSLADRCMQVTFVVARFLYSLRYVSLALFLKFKVLCLCDRQVSNILNVRHTVFNQQPKLSVIFLVSSSYMLLKDIIDYF